MVLNVDKTKIVNFNRGRGRKAKERWEYKGKEIAKVRIFKYLGYIFCRNREAEDKREMSRKANIVMPCVGNRPTKIQEQL